MINFKETVSNLHLDYNRNIVNPGEPWYDSCVKIKALIDQANRGFWNQYIPYQQFDV
jgi:hypothetical protein